MKHGSLISPDEASFGFGTSKTFFESTTAKHVSGDTVTVPDAELLFNGQFQRSGDDLKIVGQDGKAFLVSDYFKTDKHPTLLSPEGASLTPDVVDALAGPRNPGQYAQAGTPQSANQAIGRVEKVEGNATVVRNGVTITLNAGDVIQKGDVAQTGTGGALAIVFADGTAFNLAANARMVLNDFVYSAGGSNNSALISLVQGSISFVAGQVAKTGDMRVETPVATMGIRGTAVSVEINATNGQTKFSVMVEPNGTVGSFTLYDKASGAVLGTVNNSAIGWVVTPTGPLQVLAQQVQKSPAELANELFIVQQVFQTFNAGQNNPFDPNAPQQQQPNDPNRRGDNSNPQGGGSPGTPGSVNGVITVNVITQGPNTQSGNNGPNNPNQNDPNTPPNHTPDGPPVQLPGQNPTTITVNKIFGTAGNDDGQIGSGSTLIGTDGNDEIYGGAGDDIFIAAHGKGDDFFDGDGNGGNPELEAGPGFDTIRYDSANGVTFDLRGITDFNQAYSPTTGHDIFINIEKVVGSPGNDTFNLYANDAWHIDGAGGFDTIVIKGAVDIGSDIELENIEVIDLNTTNADSLRLDGADALEAIYGKDRQSHNSENEGEIGGNPSDDNETGYLKIEGSEGDRVNLSNDERAGKWSFVEGDSEGCPPQKDGYALYVFHPYGGGQDAYVYIKDGIAVDIAPDIDLPTYLTFDGDDYAASAPASTQTDNVTMEGWVRWDGTEGPHGENEGPRGQILFYNGNTSTTGFGLLGVKTEGGGLALNILAGGVDIVPTGIVLDANEWHHVALVRDGGVFTLYIDGEAVEPSFDIGVNPISGYGWSDFTMIGGNPTNVKEGFHGDISDVRIWETARDQQEINDTKFGPLTGNETGLAGYWPLTEGAGNVAPDHAGSPSNLEFHGNPVWSTGVEVNEDQSLTIHGIQISDGDAVPDEPMQVKLSVAHGALDLINAPTSLTVTYDGGTITITGTIADINAALGSGVMFIPDADYNGTDALKITVTDAGGVATSREIAVTVNDIPPPETKSITFNGTEEVYNHFYVDVEEGSAPAHGYVFLNLPDPSVGTIYGVNQTGVEITDVSELYFIPAANWFGTFELNYYAVGMDGTPDATPGKITFNWANVNDAPIVNSHDAEVNYTIGSAGVAIDTAITLSDIDSATLHGATIKIENFQDGDALIFAGLGSISGQYDPYTGVLTLTGDASVADYQAALRSISYQNNYPYASTDDRTISYQVDDGSASNHASNVATSTVHVETGSGENIAPVIDITAAQAEEIENVTIVSGISVFDNDAGDDTLFVTVTAAHGTLDFASTEAIGDTEYEGTLSEINVLLRGGVAYTPDAFDPEHPAYDDKVTLTVDDGHGGTDTINFIFKNFTTVGETQTLTGTTGKDVIFSTGHDDQLTGKGGSDTFAFSFYDGIGHDVVTDFHAGTGSDMDKILLDGAPFSKFEDLSITANLNGDAVITMGSSTVTLTGVAPEQLSAGNFIIHPGLA